MAAACGGGGRVGRGVLTRLCPAAVAAGRADCCRQHPSSAPCPLSCPGWLFCLLASHHMLSTGPSSPPDAQHVLRPVLVHLPRQRRGARAQRVCLSAAVGIAVQHLGDSGWLGVGCRVRCKRRLAAASGTRCPPEHAASCTAARMHEHRKLKSTAHPAALALEAHMHSSAPPHARRPTAGRRRSSGQRAGGSRGRWAAGWSSKRQQQRQHEHTMVQRNCC